MIYPFILQKQDSITPEKCAAINCTNTNIEKTPDNKPEKQPISAGKYCIISLYLAINIQKYK
jgi:hypothetical protein